MLNFIRNFSLLLSLFLLGLNQASAATVRHRLMFNDDPSTSITFAWDQLSGTDQAVCFGTVDHGTNWSAYTNIISPYRSTNYLGMNNQFVKVTGLLPDTKYYFVIKDSEGTTQRYWFRTCPNVNTKPLSFISGGDSRSGQTQRRNANRMVAKIRPHAVLFGGDLVDIPDEPSFKQWLDDLIFAITSDNQMIPFVHSFGNHEAMGLGGAYLLNDLFDVTPDAYYNTRFGGNLFSLYTLNGEVMPGHTIVSTTVRQNQKDWLAAQLPTDNSIWKSAQYHRPIAPHNSSKQDGQEEFNDWMQVFYDNSVRLVMESDAHCVKITKEVRPASPTATLPTNVNWFSTTNIAPGKGVTFIGEGSWGTLRPADKPQDISEATGSLYQFNWIIVTPCELLIRTVDTQNPNSVQEHKEGDYFSISPALEALVWKPSSLPTGVRKITNCTQPLASFDATSKKICKGTLVEFKDQSTNQPNTWNWNFGDGNLSTQQNPTHTYTSAGFYKVTLTVSNAQGSDSREVDQFIEVVEDPIVTLNYPSDICAGDSVLVTAEGAASYAWSTGGSDSSIVLTPNVTTDYTVVATKEGCSTTLPFTLIVKEKPELTATSDTIICAGSELILTATGAETYEWNEALGSGSTHTVYPTQNTNYVVSGTQNGCSSIDSIMVTIKDLPIVQLNKFNRDTICLNYGPINLPQGTPAGGTYIGTALQGNQFIPSIAGIGTHIITYSYLASNGCENSAQRVVCVSGCLDVIENDLTLFSLYPNPANDFITIEREQSSTYNELKVLDANGRVVWAEKMKENPHQVSVKKWKPGTYFFQFISEDGKQVTKEVIIQ